MTGLPSEAQADTKPTKWAVYRQALHSRLGSLAGFSAGPLGLALVTIVAFQLRLNLATSASLYFLIVVMVSVHRGFGEASLTSVIAVTCLNYFFVPPLLTFRVSDPQNWIDLATFEISALTVSRLSTRVQHQATVEVRQRVEVQKLYELSRRILLLDRRHSIAPQIASLIHEIFQAESVAVFDATSVRTDTTGSQIDDLDQLARDAYFQDRAVEGADARTWAHVLRLGSKPVGAIALRGTELNPLTIVPIASLSAIALERARSFENESRSEAARHTEHLRTAVLDSLAHAFKTPLTAILTASSGLLEGRQFAAGDKELVTLIDEQAMHLNRLTTELLQMAQIDAAEIRVRKERLSVSSLIEDVLARCREQLRGRRVAIAESASGLEVSGDRKFLGSALEQFIDNASKYSAPGSLISVTVAEHLCEIVIAVHNEGPPIQPSDQARIFERFYRAEESRHRASGTGLGLSIANKAAEAHGGRTWVVSEENTGTTFFIAVPRGPRRLGEPVTR